jgi:hypothetical protein
MLWREKPGPPRVKIYETPTVLGDGPFQLGITASRRLVVFQDEGNNKKIAWRSPAWD